MHEYLQQFGLDPEECKWVVGAYREARGGGAVDRAGLILALQAQLDGLDLIEQWVDDGFVAGDAYRNFTEQAIDHARYRALIDKVGGLSDQQIANIGIHCYRFWEQRPSPNV
jgi:hypothetical protein